MAIKDLKAELDRLGKEYSAKVAELNNKMAADKQAGINLVIKDLKNTKEYKEGLKASNKLRELDDKFCKNEISKTADVSFFISFDENNFICDWTRKDIFDDFTVEDFTVKGDVKFSLSDLDIGDNSFCADILALCPEARKIYNKINLSDDVGIKELQEFVNNLTSLSKLLKSKVNLKLKFVLGADGTVNISCVSGANKAGMIVLNEFLNNENGNELGPIVFPEHFDKSEEFIYDTAYSNLVNAQNSLRSIAMANTWLSLDDLSNIIENLLPINGK